MKFIPHCKLVYVSYYNNSFLRRFINKEVFYITCLSKFNS